MDKSKIPLFVDGIIYKEQKYGGISRIWQEVIPRFPDNGLSVNLLLPAHPKRNSLSVFYEKDGIKIQRDYFNWPKRIFDGNEVRSRMLINLYKAKNYQIFHSTYFTTLFTKKIAKFVTVPDLIYEMRADRMSSRWDAWVLKNKQEAINNADKIICISENTKKDLMRFYPRVSESTIAVVYLGVSNISGINQSELLDANPGVHNAQLNIRNYFLYVGKLDGYKNFQLILDLFNKQPLAQKYKFLCVGSEKNDPCRVSAEKNFPKNIIFMDNVSDQDLAFYYRNAIALIYPSLYEGFGLPVLEAMSMRCPVICSNSSSLPEVGGTAAFYFDPLSTDELFKRLTDVLTCDRESVAVKGLENCARFSWDLTTKSLISLYQEFL